MTPGYLTRLLAERPAWYQDALCAQTDPDAFFPDKGGSTRDARRVCMACPVKQECLQDALDTDERFGVRGGLSGRERRKLKPSEKPRPPLKRTTFTVEEEAYILAQHAAGVGRERIAGELDVSRHAVARFIAKHNQNGAAA